MINWKVRLHNTAWWLGMAGIVPASYMTGNAEPINTKPAEEPTKEEVNNA